MSQTLQIQLSDRTFAALVQAALVAGQSPAEAAAAALEDRYHGANGAPRSPQPAPAPEREANRGILKRHFGVVQVPDPTGADNEAIEADLAKEYADSHEEKCCSSILLGFSIYTTCFSLFMDWPVRTTTGLICD